MQRFPPAFARPLFATEHVPGSELLPYVALLRGRVAPHGRLSTNYTVTELADESARPVLRAQNSKCFASTLLEAGLASPRATTKFLESERQNDEM